MSDAELCAQDETSAQEFQKYFIKGVFDDCSLEDALGLYDQFHILEHQAGWWSKHHELKCYCQHFSQYVICHHGLLVSMVNKPSSQVPGGYLGMGLHTRGKVIRQPMKKREGREVAEAW